MGLNDLTGSLSKSRPAQPGLHPFPDVDLFTILTFIPFSQMNEHLTFLNLHQECVFLCMGGKPPSRSASCASSNVCARSAANLVTINVEPGADLRENFLNERDLVFATLDAVPVPAGDDESPFMGSI